MNIDDSNDTQGVQSNSLSDFINDHLSDSEQGFLCKYYEIAEFRDKVEDYSDCFATLSLNVRSFCGKLNEFKEFIDEINCKQFSFNVLGLQELWNIPEYLNTDIPDYSSLVYKIRESHGRNNIGGGVGFYVKKDTEFDILENLSFFEEKVFESLFIKIKTGRNKFKIIGNIYRSPGTDVNTLNQKLEDVFNIINNDQVLNKAEEIQILGDFNINLIKFESHQPTAKFLDTLLANNQLPLISLPSRITASSSTLIDNIFSNKNQGFYDSGLIYCCLSDHLPIFNISQSLNKVKKDQNPTCRVREMSDDNKANFKSLLDDINWNSLFFENNPKTAFDVFENNMNECFEKSFPYIEKKVKKQNTPREPWMTSEILNSRKIKNKLASKKIKDPSEENIKRYKTFNNNYRSLIRKAKSKHYEGKFQEYSKCIKRTWSTINELLNVKKSAHNIPDIFIDNGKIYSGTQEITEGFNSFFSSVGSNLADKIPPSETSFESYLGDPVDENFIFANITEEIILDTLKLLKSKNSSGHDKISTKLLKEIMPSIIIPVVYLFNLSIRTGFVPDSYKCARIIPIFKSGPRNIFTNYRPISLLSSFSKLLEKIIARQVFGYLNKHEILYKFQFGFRPKHDTSQPILHFLDRIYAGLNKDNPEYTLGIFLDLKKAFDTVDHKILLRKMKHYGFKGTTNKWFENYLTNRTQYVAINDSESSTRTVDCGVPQGSVLGPLLFLLYINDLPNATAFFTSLFADDTGLFFSSCDLDELFKIANSELKKAAVWFGANKLTLNVSKTKYLLFRNKGMPFSPEKYSLKIGNESIERIGQGCKEKFFKFVGMRLDEFLTWEFHIKHVGNKISSANFALNRVKHVLPFHIRKLVYNSLIRSHIEYGIIAYGGCSNKGLDRIKKLQKRAVRTVAIKSWSAHTDPLFERLQLLKFDDLYSLNVGIFMYKYINSKLPSSFNGMFQSLSEPNRTKNFILEKTKKRYLDFFPKVILPKLWNALNLELKTSQTLNLLKRGFKAETFSTYKSFRCLKHACYSCSN
jgi:hypothetical protein